MQTENKFFRNLNTWKEPKSKINLKVDFKAGDWLKNKANICAVECI